MRIRFFRRQLPPPWEEQLAAHEPTVTLSLAEAQHCQHALAWLAANFVFDSVFGVEDFVPAAETLGKLVRATEPEKDELVTTFLAEADRAAAGISEINRRSLEQ